MIKMTLREALKIQAEQITFYSKFRADLAQAVASKNDTAGRDLDAPMPVAEINALVPRGSDIEWLCGLGKNQPLPTTRETIMERQEQQQIAETILSQLGGRRFIVMTGAHSFVADSGALIFALPKSRKIRIQLTEADLYDMTFFRLAGSFAKRTIRVETIAESTGLCFDQLKTAFTLITGLETKL